MAKKEKRKEHLENVKGFFADLFISLGKFGANRISGSEKEEARNELKCDTGASLSNLIVKSVKTLLNLKA